MMNVPTAKYPNLRIGEGCVLDMDVINANKITQAWLDEQHAAGFVEPVTEVRPVMQGAPPPAPPGVNPIPVGGDGSSRVTTTDPGAPRISIPSIPGQQSSGGLSQTSQPFVPPQQAGGQALSKWNLDPATLHGKDLGQLNVMVLERDSTIAPFSTVQEAIVQLSRDWRPRTQ